MQNVQTTPLREHTITPLKRATFFRLFISPFRKFRQSRKDRCNSKAFAHTRSESVQSGSSDLDSDGRTGGGMYEDEEEFACQRSESLELVGGNRSPARSPDQPVSVTNGKTDPSYKASVFAGR
ncbi:hypothetical protein P879_11556 [Paragonimus westermani]|uniref:Uncharacterized protein n=1 Tax=Paragonimus westermani TaxID=34504 RepID=A0A8T0D5W0_9TREM|nr:hypothetical protein P879_11556 [Paragonimus westermani]